MINTCGTVIYNNISAILQAENKREKKLRIRQLHNLKTDASKKPIEGKVETNFSHENVFLFS